jgi:hypothetical protein
MIKEFMALTVMCKISGCYYKYEIPEAVKSTWYTFQKMFIYATTCVGTAQTPHKDRSLPTKR